ncbi:hypothetical protein COB52_05020 [Candidatus Kaiserbacteria bacterium]|nr:MAG: hypothetical protein COB52_05020 [Candidatus Kaiserbacteria bacterium]
MDFSVHSIFGSGRENHSPLKDDLSRKNLKFSNNGGVNLNGFSVHSGVSIKTGKRSKLEKLCRYIGRGPFSVKGMFALPWGEIGYRLKNTWNDGTTHIVFTRKELVEKLVALLPRSESEFDQISWRALPQYFG